MYTPARLYLEMVLTNEFAGPSKRSFDRRKRESSLTPEKPPLIRSGAELWTPAFAEQVTDLLLLIRPT